jgi:hypothetical protein
VRFLAVVLAAGCGFHPSSNLDDAPRTSDAAIDARVTTPSCTLAVTGMGSDAGRIGDSSGGTAGPALACPPQQEMVGVALLVSDGIAGGPQERSAQGISIACARVTLGSPNATGPATTFMVMGNGGANFSPAHSTGFTSCPPGDVITGFAVHSGQFDSAFIDATLTCTELDAALQVVADSLVYVEGSLTEPMHPNGAACAAGAIAASFVPRTGAGLDSLEMACAVPVCPSQ